MTAMIHSQKPPALFHFSGDSSGIILPPLRRWPQGAGFTFATWIRLESCDADTTAGPAAGADTVEPMQPHLYLFATASGEGYRALLRDGHLVVQSLNPDGSIRSSLACETPLELSVWYHVVIAHERQQRMGRSVAHVYINGSLVASGPFRLVQNYHHPFLKCYLGCADRLQASSLLNGQMGAVYLFSTCLASETVAAMARLGMGYRNNFQYESEGESVGLDARDKQQLYAGGRLAGNMVFNFNAKACEGLLCMESSPTLEQSHFLHSPHATLLEGV